MGQFSWFTQDTHERIINGKPMHVVMTDDKNNHWVEECYEGYGVFGGKDFYELLAEMNGLSMVKLTDGSSYAITTDSGRYVSIHDSLESVKDAMRLKGIEMAFDGHPCGDNPNLKWPSLTSRGWYCNGECPETDPNQGFPDEESYDEDFE